MEYNLHSNSIYYEALWVLLLFGATAALREAVGELCTHSLAKSILSSSHVTGRIIDTFTSCSNGGRSLGFGAAWRMWRIDSTGIVRRKIVLLPFLCWIVGLPIKLIAVQAVRGGNSVLGKWGTWTLGISWIIICFSAKLIAIVVDKRHGLKDSNGKVMSYRKLYQARICSLESYGMMTGSADDYDESTSFLVPKPKESPLGLDISWTTANNGFNELTIKLKRGNDISDSTPNGLAYMLSHSLLGPKIRKENEFEQVVD